MILTVTLNPSVDHAIFLDELKVGDTNRVRRTEIDAGGKGINLSRVVAALGGRTVATGFLGGPAGACVSGVLDAEDVPHDFVQIEGETRTNVSVEDKAGNPPTTFNDRGPGITVKEWEALLDKCDALAAEATFVALGGSLPPGVPTEAFQILTERLRARGLPVLVDADGEPMLAAMEAHPTMIKPNSKEAGRLLGTEVETDEQAIEACCRLRDRLAPGGIALLSRGGKGAIMAAEKGVFIGRSPQVEVKSTIGCGDSLLGGFLWALTSGKDPAEALQWGMTAGASTAATSGAGLASRQIAEILYSRAEVERVG